MKHAMGATLMAGMLLFASILAACGGNNDGESANTPTRGDTAVAANSTPTIGGSGSSQAPTTIPQPSGGTADVRAPLETGSSAEVHADDPDPNSIASSISELGRVRVTIVAIHDDLDAGDSIFPPGEGNRYWALQVTMEALDDKRVNSGFWTLRTSDGSEYEWSYVPGLDMTTLNYNAIEPGEVLEGLIVFEIPEGATVESLKMDPHIFVGGNLVFE
jgi:hypothetical protein